MKSVSFTAALILAASCLSASAQQSQTTIESRSFYDRNGSFAGSSSRLNNGTTSVYDRNGSYAGQSIRNSDGTTSVYDRNGHFTGSAVNTTPPGSLPRR
jgi:hypothetical protein